MMIEVRIHQLSQLIIIFCKIEEDHNIKINMIIFNFNFN